MKHLLLIFTTLYTFHTFSQEQKADNQKESVLIKPTLFADLGESCSTPDGMAIDQFGKLFLAVTNLSTFEKFGSKILTFNEKNQPIIWFDQLPLHPVTKRVHPMGIEFGSDGNLYIADNQYFAGEKNQSRILRVIVENGNPIKTEVLVEGLGFANGIRINNNRVYVTDFMFENEKESGIYSFTIEELKKNPITLNEQTRKDHLISSFPVGIDGLTFDQNGNLYAGHFYTGVITKIGLSKEGVVQSKEIFLESEELKCADGMFFDKRRNSIFIANLNNNSVHQLDVTTKDLKLIWINENNNGLDGSLDNPCETILYQGNLIVVNFDTFEGDKNKEVDQFHTISKFKIVD